MIMKRTRLTRKDKSARKDRLRSEHDGLFTPSEWREIEKLFKKLKPSTAAVITDVPKIEKMIKGKEHLGTYFIAGGGFGVKTKTFNLYNLGDKFLVTNHYGSELVNASVYPNMQAVKTAFGKITWTKYSHLLMP
jgi:hypothetical protein